MQFSTIYWTPAEGKPSINFYFFQAISNARLFPALGITLIEIISGITRLLGQDFTFFIFLSSIFIICTKCPAAAAARLVNKVQLWIQDNKNECIICTTKFGIGKRYFISLVVQVSHFQAYNAIARGLLLPVDWLFKPVFEDRKSKPKCHLYQLFKLLSFPYTLVKSQPKINHARAARLQCIEIDF